MSQRIETGNGTAVVLLDQPGTLNINPTLSLICTPGNCAEFTTPDQARHLAAVLLAWARTAEEPASA